MSKKEKNRVVIKKSKIFLMLSALHECIDSTKKAIDLLENKINEIKSHHTVCNVVKTGGTTASVSGALIMIASIVAAPFTGGASVILGTGLGSVLSLGGTAVILGSDVVDHFASKGFQKDIQRIIDRRSVYVCDLKKYYEKIQYAVEGFCKQGLSEKEAVFTAISAAVTCKSAADFSRVCNSASNLSNFTLRNGGKAWQSMRKTSEQLITVSGKLGFNIGKGAAMSVIRNGTVILNAAFIIYDIKSLIGSWKNEHPTLEAVKKVITDLKEQLQNLIEFEKTLESIK